MRRLFQQEKWKRHLAARSEQELAKKSRRKFRSRHRPLALPSPKKQPSIYLPVVKKKGQIRIVAPSQFNLQNNTDETMQFFNTVNYYIQEQKKLYLDLSKVEQLSTEVIAYLLSRLEFSKQIGDRTDISGNIPNEPRCNELFRSSGFYTYVFHNRASPLYDKNVFAIESGTMVNPTKASQIKSFVTDRLSRGKGQDTRGLYETIIECMANTRNHAYPRERLYRKWWLTASFNADNKNVQITFLDNGVTIPVTIRRDFHEQVRQVFAQLTSVGDVKDFALIESALEGRFRTRTRQRYRGKGLPKINKFLKEGKIKNLLIVSKRGFLDVAKTNLKELSGDFQGTLLRWEMS